MLAVMWVTHGTLLCILGGLVEGIRTTTCTGELLEDIIFATGGIIPASKATKGNRNWMLRSQEKTT